MNSMREMPRVRMLVLIINHKDAEKAAAILEAHSTPVQHLCRGEGTASSELMDYLGIGATDKAVLLCPVEKKRVPELFDALEKGLRLDKPGRGIVFTFPVSGASSFIMQLLREDIQEKIAAHLERNVAQMTGDITHNLLMVMINQGYSEEAMAAAKAAGASGGTVLRARRLGADEAMKRWGICVQGEREIIFILAEHEKKLEIMRAIGAQCGLHSEAQGIVVSIPVDAVAGLAGSAQE